MWEGGGGTNAGQKKREKEKQRGDIKKSQRNDERERKGFLLNLHIR